MRRRIRPAQRQVARAQRHSTEHVRGGRHQKLGTFGQKTKTNAANFREGPGAQRAIRRG